MIRFGSHKFKGTHGRLVVPPPDLHAMRSYFYGLHGTTEIVGGRGGRELSVDICLHDEYRMDEELIHQLLQLDTMIGDNEDLHIEYENSAKLVGSGDNRRVTTHKSSDDYFGVTFQGFFPEGFGSQPAVPLFDLAGTIDHGWYIMGHLKFYEL